MNYLAHLYLAEAAGSSPAGNVLGDSVHGRLQGNFPAAIENGIRLHRAVDSYTDSHPLVRAALCRFQPPLRRYAGICIDIYFDYLLACDWADWHTQQLGAFARRISNDLYREWPRPPFTRQRLDGLAQVLASSAEVDSVHRALTRVDARAKTRPTPLLDAVPVLQAQHDALQADFRTFFPDVKAFAETQAKAIRGQSKALESAP